KVVLSSGPPFINGFAATEEGNTNYWDIIGHVSDGNFSAAGLTVQITGSPVSINNNGQGLGVTVDSCGNFDLCVRLTGNSSDNGLPPLVQWVQRHLPGQEAHGPSRPSDMEWAAPSMARLLCDRLLEQMRPPAPAARETVVGR